MTSSSTDWRVRAVLTKTSFFYEFKRPDADSVEYEATAPHVVAVGEGEDEECAGFEVNSSHHDYLPLDLLIGSWLLFDPAQHDDR